jgi:hypothetical protein
LLICTILIAQIIFFIEKLTNIICKSITIIHISKYYRYLLNKMCSQYGNDRWQKMGVRTTFVGPREARVEVRHVGSLQVEGNGIMGPLFLLTSLPAASSIYGSLHCHLPLLYVTQAGALKNKV